MLLVNETVVSVRADGKYVLAPTSRMGEAAIFDSLGAVGRPFGRLGGGPGENGRLLNVLPWRGDSVLLVGFDRLMVLGGERGGGRTIRIERTSASHRTVILPADGMIVRNYPYPPDRQFVAFDTDGNIRSEAGRAWSSRGVGNFDDAIAELGPPQRPHTFWSAANRYRIHIDLWDVRDGAHLQTIEYAAPWYPTYDSAAFYRFIAEGGDEVHPPPPFLRGIRESADTILWLLYDVPARNWTPRHDTLPPAAAGVRLHREAYDGVIDLRDPRSGAELLTVWINLPFIAFVNDTLLVDRVQDEDGFFVEDIYKVSFRRQ